MRSARLAAGLTLRDVGKAVGVVASTVLSHEPARRRGERPGPLARHAAVVGMRLRIKAYPEGAPIRDAAQVALVRAFRDRIGTALKLQLEQLVVGTPGDMRAFDATLALPGGCGVEFITRFHDCQAQLRAVLLKQRDSGVARLVIVVKATHANRRAVASAADIIATTLPLGTRATLAALAMGHDPGENALVLL